MHENLTNYRLRQKKLSFLQKSHRFAQIQRKCKLVFSMLTLHTMLTCWYHVKHEN